MNLESPESDAPMPQSAEVPSGPDLTSPVLTSPTRRTRISEAWVGVTIGVAVLVFLLVFIIQNSRSVKVSCFTWSVNMPALLLAAVGGVLLAGIVASLPIWQLRHRVHQSK